jgi:signal transduction histidine kinase
MEERIWSNPEMKNTYFKMVLAAIIFTVFAVFYFGSLFENFNKGLLDKNIATAGILVQKHPELKDDIIRAFTSEAGMKELQSGIAAAAEYGFTDKLPISVIPLINSYYANAIISIVIFSLICFLFAGFIIYSFKKKIYFRAREAANAAEKIVEGDFNVKLNEQDEGDFSKLGHQFNQMAKRLALTLEQLKNEKMFLKNIISDISHQLKTPLSSIKIFNELLASGNVKEKNDWDRFLNKSGEQIERMEWLIQNLLVMARIEAGAVEFANEYKSLNCTVENVVDSFKEKFKLKNLNVILTNAESEIYLLHDEKWLGEAIGNIVKNSMEHTQINGNISIETSSSPVMIRIVIKDDGEGICSEDLPHIFKRFYKGKNNLHGSGTGLGLALSKAIIESQGGMIGVTSTLNVGTTFTVTFPNLNN